MAERHNSKSRKFNNWGFKIFHSNKFKFQINFSQFSFSLRRAATFVECLPHELHIKANNESVFAKTSNLQA